MNHSFVSALITTFIKEARIELLIVLTVQGDARGNDNADFWLNKKQQLMTNFIHKSVLVKPKYCVSSMITDL